MQSDAKLNIFTSHTDTVLVNKRAREGWYDLCVVISLNASYQYCIFCLEYVQ